MPKETTLDDLLLDTSQLSMAVCEAEAAAKRVAVHLRRGSIEAAREALEDAWRGHLANNAELPNGPALLDEPISRVVDNLRTLNMLESDGILTIGQLLNSREDELYAIANMGTRNVVYLREICRKIRDRAGLVF